MIKDGLIRLKLFLFGLILFSLLLPLVLPSILGKILLLLCVSWIFTNFRFPHLRDSILFKIIACQVLISLVGMTLTSNYNYGWSYLETQLSLLVLPLLILTNNSLIEKRESIIIRAFVLGVLTLNLTSLFFISYDLWDPKNLQSNLITANNIIVNIHPAFLSMYISFCIFFLVDQYFPLRNLDRKKLGWVIFSLIVFLVFLIWLNSRAGILAFLLSAFFFIGLKWSGKTRTLGLAILVIFLLLMTLLPFSRYRFLETPKMVLTERVLGSENDPSVFPLVNRIQVIECNLELLRWPEILYGYGTGDFRDELQKCFETKNFRGPLSQNMDSHSEYFAQLHRSGVMGLGLFLALLIIPFRHALKYKSPLLGSFIVMFATIALFENVFSAQKGITFYALFCPLLWIMAKQEYEAKTHKSDHSFGLKS